jgi:hypothetical protein
VTANIPKESQRPKIKFNKAISPSKRKVKKAPSVHEPRVLSPMATYIEEHYGTPGLPIDEIFQQYRDYECEHSKLEVIATAASFQLLCCDECKQIVRKNK